LRLGARGFDWNERALADAGAISRGLAPLGALFDQLRPKGKDAALGWLDGVNGAPALAKKMTLRFARNAQTKLAAGAVTIPLLECLPTQAQVFRDALRIGFGQIDKPLFGAAGDAARLAGKTQTFGHGLIMRQAGVSGAIFFRPVPGLFGLTILPRLARSRQETCARKRALAS